MKNKIFLLFILLAYLLLPAQELRFKWAAGFGSKDPDWMHSMVSDAQGNTYTTGWFQGRTDFDPDPVKTYFMTPSNRSIEMFVLKLNANGKLAWAVSIGLKSSSEGTSLTLDKAGNVTITGRFYGKADFDPDPLKTFELNSPSENNAFVMQLSKDGKFKWAVQMSHNIRLLSLCSDQNNNVIGAGLFSDSFAYPLGSNTNKHFSKGQNDVLLLKMDSAGNMLWFKQIGDIGYEHAKAVSSDSAGNLLLSGEFQYTCDMDPGAGQFVLQGYNNNNYLLKLDKNGAFLWAKALDIQIEYGYSDKHIAFDRKGDIYMSGFIFDTCDFDPDTLKTAILPALGQHDGFIMKMNADGGFLWVKGIGGNDSDVTIAEVFTICLDSNGNIYGTGRFSESVDFDPGSGTYKLLALGYLNTFLMKLDTAGNLQWAKAILGAGEGYAIGVSTAGEVYVSGEYGGTPDFDADPLKEFRLPSFGSNDFFVCKYGNCKSSSSVQNISTCGPATVNGIVYDSSGQFIQTISKADGCDSLLTLNLNIIKTDTGIFRRSNTLYARMRAPGISYQWIDCNAGNKLIPGAVDSMFTPSANGSYAVIIINNDCLDTSACMAVTGLGISDFTAGPAFTMYPNPLNEGHLTIETGLTNAVYVVFGSDGKCIQKGTIDAGLNRLSLNLAKGCYLFEVSDGIVFSRKFLLVN